MHSSQLSLKHPKAMRLTARVPARAKNGPPTLANTAEHDKNNHSPSTDNTTVAFGSARFGSATARTESRNRSIPGSHRQPIQARGRRSVPKGRFAPPCSAPGSRSVSVAARAATYGTAESRSEQCGATHVVLRASHRPGAMPRRRRKSGSRPQLWQGFALPVCLATTTFGSVSLSS